MRKSIVRFFVIALIAALLPSMSIQAASKKKVYKAYYNWLVKSAPSAYKKYCLVDLDGDNISELVGFYCNKKYGVINNYIICYYDGKKVVTKTFTDGVASVGGYRGSLTYIPRKGKIMDASLLGGTGSQSNEVYKLKNGTLKRTAIANIEYVNGKAKYKWNGKSVSKKTYTSKLKKAFNTSNPKAFSDLKYISKAKMKKALK